jgi:GH18 family chitinase
MSWAFVSALKKNPQQSYVQLLNSIRDELAKKYTQKPQLSCSHPLGKSLVPTARTFEMLRLVANLQTLDTNLLFVM